MEDKLRFGAPSTRYSFDRQLHRMGRVLQIPTDATPYLARQKFLPRKSFQSPTSPNIT
jgi:hypothetical protein